jgi:hypothetical protein
MEKELEVMKAKEESQSHKMLNLEDTIRSLEKENKALKAEIAN